jgi:hypothetical protein
MYEYDPTFGTPVAIMTNPITAWNNIGKKMNSHSIAGSNGPRE